MPSSSTLFASLVMVAEGGDAGQSVHVRPQQRQVLVKKIEQDSQGEGGGARGGNSLAQFASVCSLGVYSVYSPLAFVSSFIFNPFISCLVLVLVFLLLFVCLAVKFVFFRVTFDEII